jgi:type IV secretory pathway VirB2 component (pilin)
MKQRMHKKIMVLVAVLLAVNFIFSFSALAATNDPNVLWGGPNEKRYIENNSGLPVNTGGSGDIRQVIAQVIRVVLGFLGIIAVVIILFAGFKWMMAGGNEEKVGEAKKMLVAGLIGLVIILSAYALANFVISQIYGATTGNPVTPQG